MRILLVLTTMLALFPVGALAQAIQVQPANVTLVDANGKQIGAVVGVTENGGVTVAFIVNGRGALLTAVADSTTLASPTPVLPLLGSHELYFESTDCSGAPLIFDVSVIEGSAVAPPGLTLYMVNPTATLTVTTRSRIDAFGVCVPSSTALRRYHPAVSVLDLLTVFRPPFRLVFSAVAAPVPTLSEWWMIGMGGLLVALGFWAIRRRFASGAGASI